jgi:crotonobetainyl-CoA:carnitine CoA-transferase CaiB-like acyl-CoA transferase
VPALEDRIPGDGPPLAGITVVTIEHAVAAPLASRHLADLGARVIKVERPDGGDFARHYDTAVRGLSSHFVWLNRSKESVALDLGSVTGRTALDRLLDRADVFLHNLAPGGIDRLGFGTAAVRARRPRLIVCAISGYGPTGPDRDRKAYDLLIQCEAGVVSLTGSPDAPAKAGIPVADIAAGMYAYSGILAALLRRERTGDGAALDVSMLEALAEWVGFPLYYTRYGGEPPPRTGASHATIAPYGPVTARDGEQVFLAVQNEREWERLCRAVLQDPALAADPRFATAAARLAHRAALDRRIGAVTATMTADDLIARLDAAGIANARLRDMTQVADHPQLAARGRWRTVRSEAGELDALLPPVAFGDVPMGPVPRLGEHTATVLAELGLA